MERINQAGANTQYGHFSNSNQTDVAHQNGKYNGEKVNVSSLPKSALDAAIDGAEEMSLHKGEKAERKNKGEEKIETDTQMFEKIYTIENINQYLELAKQDEQMGQVKDTAQNILAAQGKNARGLAGQSFKNPTMQYLALSYALNQGRSDGASAETLDNIADALIELGIEFGSQVRADLNTIEAAGSFGKTTEEVSVFQSTYQDAVFAANNLAQTVNIVLERLGINNQKSFDLNKVKEGLLKMVSLLLNIVRCKILSLLCGIT